MKNYQFVVKAGIVSFLLLGNTITFGMEQYPRKYEMEVSPLEYQGRRNLKKLYKNPDPKYVKKMLSKHHVPVVMIDLSVRTNGQNVAIDVINPYDPSFYPNSNQQILGKKLTVIEKQRFDEAFVDCYNKRAQQVSAMNLPVPDSLNCKLIKKNDPLMLAAILGNRNDISKKLENCVNDTYISPADLSARIFHATIASTCYPYTKKKNLLLLLLEQKKIQKYSNYTLPDREVNAYKLLLHSAKNKENFKIIAQADPYEMNGLAWKLNTENDYCTHMDRMNSNRNFDEDHINIMIANGGLTNQDVLEQEAVNNSGEWSYEEI